MNRNDAASALEAVLVAENAALERADPQAAVALVKQKVAAANALDAGSVSDEAAERLRDLAAENRRLLEGAIEVQNRIITIIARAAQAVPSTSRYGAEGKAIAPDGALAITRQA